MQDSVYRLMPHFIQNLFVTGYNIKSYRQRYSGRYRYFLDLFKKNRILSFDKLKNIQNDGFLQLLDYTLENSLFYNQLYSNIEKPESVSDIGKLPVISKEDLRKNIENVYTISKKDGIHSKTGSTTGH